MRIDKPSFDQITRSFYSLLHHNDATVLMRVSGHEERMLTRFKFLQILHKLLIVNHYNNTSSHDYLFMLVENPCFTLYTHYIEIDEHSEMEVRNEVKSEEAVVKE
jgi:hypothetical protein